MKDHSYYGEKSLERIRKCELDAVKHQEESSRMFQNMKQMATFGPFGSFGSFVDPPTSFPTLSQPVPTYSLHEEESYTEEEKEAKELLLSNSSSSIEEISLFSSYDYFLTTDVSESGAGATLKKGNKIIKTRPSQGSTTQSNMLPNRRGMLALLMAYQDYKISKILNLRSPFSTFLVLHTFLSLDFQIPGSGRKKSLLTTCTSFLK
ncbi:hypothetical protein ACTFIW_000936 [Dictyostelium discoideum]